MGWALKCWCGKVQKSVDADADAADPSTSPASSGASNSTEERVVAVKKCIEKHYIEHMKRLQERKDRRASLERKLVDSNIPKDEEQRALGDLDKKESEYMRLRRCKMRVDHFELLKKIGKGAFGDVWVCREKASGKVYAMKTLRKSEMMKRGQVEHVRSERNLLGEIDSDYVVKLYCSFQDEEFLYLIMEYLPGGDIVTLLNRRYILSEEETRFYIGEAVLAIESIHNHNYIHRDIKPDNILLDKHGHLKLSDFGLCKSLQYHCPSYTNHNSGMWNHVDANNQDDWASRRTMAYSRVGTPDYMAPEVVRKRAYSFGCDWWSLGVVMYEMLIGYPPFESEDRNETKRKILNWRIHLIFPRSPQISSEAKDLIRRLLCDDCDRIGAKEIKCHPWFTGLQWEKIYQMEPKFVPNVRDELDTRNFCRFEESEIDYEGRMPAKLSPWRKVLSPKDLNFLGYTYKNFGIVGGHKFEEDLIEQLKKRTTAPAQRRSVKSIFEVSDADELDDHQHIKALHKIIWLEDMKD